MDLNWQFWLHLALAILGTLYFLYSFLKEKKVYQILFVIWIPITLLTYVCKRQWQILILGGIQLIFFVLVLFFLFRNPAKKKGVAEAVEQEPIASGEAMEAEETLAEDMSDTETLSETADTPATEENAIDEATDTESNEASDQN